MMIPGHKSTFKTLLTGTILWIMGTLTGLGQSREEETDSLNLLEINKSIINNNNNPQALAHLYLKLGKSYESIYGFNKFSLEAFQQSAGLFKQTGDSANYYDAIMKVATIYYVDNFTKKYALEHYYAALRYFKKTGDIENKIHCQLSIIDTKKLQKPFDYKLITELKEVEKECISYRYDLQLSYAHNLLAICHIINGNLNEARKYANLSQMYAEGAKIKWLVSLNYFYMGKIEDHNHQKKKALDYYLKALALSGETKNVAYAKDITEAVAACYTDLGDHKNANIYHKKTLSFINQFYESEQTKNFRLEKVNNQFKNLQAESKLIEQEIRKTNMQNVILVIVLIFLVSGAIALYIGNRQQKLISNQQELINEQKIKNLELKSLESLMQGQENERSRIARDLHDSLGIQLSQIKFFIETHGKNFLPEEKKSVNRIIDEAFYEIRVISHNIHPFSLSNFGLIIALEDLIHKLQSIKKTEISIRKYGNFPELNQEAIALLYRAIQELINNALKHAHPNKIIIQIITNEEELLINVEDDGNGFEVGQEEKGSGINNVIFRVEYLSGQVIWQSSPERGTSVMISVPLKKVTAS